MYVQEVLEGHDERCKREFRMETHVFKALVKCLKDKGLILDTKYVSAEEQVAMFLFTLSKNASNHSVQERFQHSEIRNHEIIDVPDGDAEYAEDIDSMNNQRRSGNLKRGKRVRCLSGHRRVRPWSAVATVAEKSAAPLWTAAATVAKMSAVPLRTATATVAEMSAADEVSVVASAAAEVSAAASAAAEVSASEERVGCGEGRD
ncbi:hypothetical protein ACMD2_18072 [Ananas comosus]|uniref:DUF8040 domain-containing protein n=1 Tax=Ananas comosus TaxID=4615 RepID=A0A199UJC3_ANACO|nr:hypothetical protein ACMD2_18072 [Ananas comosus]